MITQIANEIYVPGLWYGTIYGHNGDRFDEMINLRTDGTFRRALVRSGQRSLSTGSWRYASKPESLSCHEDELGVLYLDTLDPVPDLNKSGQSRWTTHVVSGCENSNCMLVLRHLVLASRNLPIVFYRSHEDPENAWIAMSGRA